MDMHEHLDDYDTGSNLVRAIRKVQRVSKGIEKVKNINSKFCDLVWGQASKIFSCHSFLAGFTIS